MVNFISINLNYLINKINSTQAEFGALFGIAGNAVSSYVAGSVKPKIETIDKICSYFEISIDDFLKVDLSKQANKPIATPEIEAEKQQVIIDLRKTVLALEENALFLREKIIATQKELLLCEKERAALKKI